MPFMEKQVTDSQKWIEVDTAHGITFLPCDTFGTFGLDTAEELTEEAKTDLLQYLDVHKIDQIYSAEVREGFGARLSAPGYMDCTEWAVFDTEAGAGAYLEEYYGAARVLTPDGCTGRGISGTAWSVSKAFGEWVQASSTERTESSKASCHPAPG